MCINMLALQRHEPSNNQIWKKFKVAKFGDIALPLFALFAFERTQSRLVLQPVTLYPSFSDRMNL